jgi:hypothetical protein
MRKFHARRDAVAQTSWLARQITGYIAAGYMVEKGKPNSALDNSAKLSMDDIETVLLGGSTSDKPKENANGSFERFMLTFGSKGQAR